MKNEQNDEEIINSVNCHIIFHGRKYTLHKRQQILPVAGGSGGLVLRCGFLYGVGGGLVGSGGGGGL